MHAKKYTRRKHICKAGESTNIQTFFIALFVHIIASDKIKIGFKKAKESEVKKRVFYLRSSFKANFEGFRLLWISVRDTQN